jgi:hypothetical protein
VAPVDTTAGAADTLLLATLPLRRRPSLRMLPDAVGPLLAAVSLAAADSDTPMLLVLVASTSLSSITSWVSESKELPVGS